MNSNVKFPRLVISEKKLNHGNTHYEEMGPIKIVKNKRRDDLKTNIYLDFAQFRCSVAEEGERK